ncbi:MAG: ABC transporter permease [Cyanobium sp.]|uniref:ABC transporter permease n=1 Tax=Synechococcus sp. CS-1333 TaxID=2848638 RepID=UPI000DBBEACD|nr:ABC transporter permease subunit [Synechococcus sp. CS-1333]MCT0211656.1 ABC transporter permease subunit [Synechococcus sp. CS-1333]PZV21134.1 MAG: ABC transporter permease [Cyanobium sp.]
MNRTGALLLGVWSVLAYGLLYAPVVVTVLFSFNAPRGRFNLLWQGFTLENWRHPLRNVALTQAFLTSLGLALAAALLAVLLGGLMALALSRARLRAGRWIELLLALPLTNPEIVLATALFTLFVRVDLPRGPLTLLLSHSLFCLSYAALTLKARLAGFDPTLELAAQDLGAPPLAAFRRVTLPLLAPGLLAATLLSFSLSFDDYVISSFTAGEIVTLPLYLAGAFQREISPQIQVLSTLVLLVSAVLLVLASPPRQRRG